MYRHLWRDHSPGTNIHLIEDNPKISAINRVFYICIVICGKIIPQAQIHLIEDNPNISVIYRGFFVSSSLARSFPRHKYTPHRRQSKNLCDLWSFFCIVIFGEIILQAQREYTPHRRQSQNLCDQQSFFTYVSSSMERSFPRHKYLIEDNPKSLRSKEFFCIVNHSPGTTPHRRQSKNLCDLLSFFCLIIFGEIRIRIRIRIFIYPFHTNIYIQIWHRV